MKEGKEGRAGDRPAWPEGGRPPLWTYHWTVPRPTATSLVVVCASSRSNPITPHHVLLVHGGESTLAVDETQSGSGWVMMISMVGRALSLLMRHSQAVDG